MAVSEAMFLVAVKDSQVCCAGDASATDTLWTESSRQSSCLGCFLVDLIVFSADVRRVCFDNRFSACSSSASFCMASEATAL